MSNHSRGYYSLFLRQIEEAELDPAVAQFAAGCIARGIPVAAVAEWMGVTRVTVYNWFTGKTTPRAAQLARIQKAAVRFPRIRIPHD